MKTFSRSFKLLVILATLTLAACELDPVPEPTDYSGTWNCSEQSSLYGTQTFQISVTNDPIWEGRVLMANFYNLGYSEKATVDLLGFDVDIPSQSIAGKTLSGSGSIKTSKRIELDYVISDGIDADTVSSVMTR